MKKQGTRTVSMRMPAGQFSSPRKTDAADIVASRFLYSFTTSATGHSGSRGNCLRDLNRALSRGNAIPLFAANHDTPVLDTERRLRLGFASVGGERLLEVFHPGISRWRHFLIVAVRIVKRNAATFRCAETGQQSGRTRGQLGQEKKRS